MINKRFDKNKNKFIYRRPKKLNTRKKTIVKKKSLNEILYLFFKLKKKVFKKKIKNFKLDIKIRLKKLKKKFFLKK